MTDFNSPEITNLKKLSFQEKLQQLWNNSDSWEEVMTVIIKGLPQGMRVLKLNNGPLILRFTMNGLPEELNGEPLKNKLLNYGKFCASS